MQRWESFREELERLGVTLVAISPDTAEAAGEMKERLGLGFPILSDESLAVTDLFGIRHHRGFAVDPSRPMKRPLCVPTTFLVDAEGIVRWIDQHPDYRVRSTPERVLEEVALRLSKDF